MLTQYATRVKGKIKTVIPVHIDTSQVDRQMIIEDINPIL